ncbi:MAG TPA: hypothetical protein VGO60_06760 [Iamia sp.]|jgi:hypothetical protein|nr:hypothetical protein [Iamia sp.]
MPLSRTAVRALAGACALTLVLAACGGDTEDSAEVVDDHDRTTEAVDETTASTADDDSTITATDETTTTEADDGTEGDPDAVALAQRVNLTLDDLDETWTEDPAAADDGSPTIDDCFVETDIETVTVGRAKTGTFAYEPSDDAVQLVTMQTVVLDGPETATALVAEFGGDAFATCASGVLRDSFGEGGEATLALRPDEPAWTEESTGLVGDLTIPNGDSTFSGVADLHILRTAEVVSFTATVDVGDVGIEGLLGQIYATVAERHATEVG